MQFAFRIGYHNLFTIPRIGLPVFTARLKTVSYLGHETRRFRPHELIRDISPTLAFATSRAG
jgi:cytochrome bd-type quinol oxidase subunit 1